jgi:hypothetical protein
MSTQFTHNYSIELKRGGALFGEWHDITSPADVPTTRDGIDSGRLIQRTAPLPVKFDPVMTAILYREVTTDAGFHVGFERVWFKSVANIRGIDYNETIINVMAAAGRAIDTTETLTPAQRQKRFTLQRSADRDLSHRFGLSFDDITPSAFVSDDIVARRALRRSRDAAIAELD